jgi:hypothetical protein
MQMLHESSNSDAYDLLNIKSLRVIHLPRAQPKIMNFKDPKKWEVSINLQVPRINGRAFACWGQTQFAPIIYEIFGGERLTSSKQGRPDQLNHTNGLGLWLPLSVFAGNSSQSTKKPTIIHTYATKRTLSQQGESPGQWSMGFNWLLAPRRLNLNNPATAVGGISFSGVRQSGDC